MRRKGHGQTEIAKKEGVTRQAVSKAIRSYERTLLTSLLGLARSIGGLVEWYDVGSGVLFGVVPQLDNRGFLILTDTSGDLRVFYATEQGGLPSEVGDIVRSAMGISLKNLAFKQVVDQLVGK